MVLTVEEIKAVLSELVEPLRTAVLLAAARGLRNTDGYRKQFQ